MKKLINLSLLISLCFNTVFLYLLHTSFLKIQFSRTFPSGKTFSKPTQSKTLKNSLTLLGDSRVQLWPTVFIDSELKLINKGLGGQTSTQLVYNLSNEYMNSKIIFIQTCINDFHWLNLSPEYGKHAVEQCKKNILYALTTLHSRGVKVILSTIIPPGNPSIFRKLYWPDNIESILIEVNDFIRNQKSDLTYILHADKILKKADTQYIQKDLVDSDFFLHINNLAYRKLSKKLNKILLQL